MSLRECEATPNLELAVSLRECEATLIPEKCVIFWCYILTCRRWVVYLLSSQRYTAVKRTGRYLLRRQLPRFPRQQASRRLEFDSRDSPSGACGGRGLEHNTQPLELQKINPTSPLPRPHSAVRKIYA